MTEKKVLIIIPAFNEQGNIGKTVRSVFALGMPLSIVVINDGSLDSTAREAFDAGAQVISLPFNLGIGGAVQTGFQFAFHNDFDFAIQVDGDGQHDAVFLKNLLEPLLEDRADLVIGSRFLTDDEDGFKSSFTRRVGIHFFSHLISFLTGCKTTDPTSGFRACNRFLIKAFARSYPHDFPEPEAIVLAKRLNARILEIPVVMKKRGAGKSSIRFTKSVYYMVKVTFAIMLDMIKQKKAVV